MPQFAQRIFAATALLLIATSLPAQWRPMNSFSNLIVYEIARRNDTLFAGTQYGVYRSFDAGASWAESYNGMKGYSSEYLSVWSIASNDRFVFAGTMNGLYRSSNDGASWESDTLGGDINSLLARGNTVLATTDYGVYRSHDDGVT